MRTSLIVMVLAFRYSAYVTQSRKIYRRPGQRVRWELGEGVGAYQFEASLQTASDFVVDSGRDTLDTAAAGETAGGEGVSFRVVQVSRRAGSPRTEIPSQQQGPRKRRKRTYRMAGFATQREKRTAVSNLALNSPQQHQNKASNEYSLTPWILSFKPCYQNVSSIPNVPFQKYHPPKGKEIKRKINRKE